MSLTNKWYQKEVDELLDEILSTSSRGELGGLLNVILTPREINDCARRLKALRMLKDGKSYSQIYDKVGLCDSSVAKLSAGAGYGFRRSFSKVGESAPARRRKKVTILPKYKGVPALKI
jgi:uncharacterized protein YerC